MIALPIIVLLGALSGLILLCRFPRLSLKSHAQKRQTISVIIPARNEAKNLPVLLGSLQNQTASPLEVIVVDDGSTDDTSDVATSFNVRVIPVTNKSAEWTGKTYALQMGAQHASGELLLFLDADTKAEPTLIEQLSSNPQAPKTVRSIQPFHRTKKAYEELSFLFNALIFMGIGAFTAWGSKVKPSGSFGPALCIRKDDYTSLGGHEKVKGTVLEHFSMGALFEENGFSQELYSGRGLLSFRMYPNGIGELLEGWIKGFFSGASGSKPLFLGLSIFWISSLLLYPLSFITIDSPLSMAILLSAVILSLLHFTNIRREVGSFSPLNIILLPLQALFFITIFTISTIKIKVFKKVTWRGREVKV